MATPPRSSRTGFLKRSRSRQKRSTGRPSARSCLPRTRKYTPTRRFDMPKKRKPTTDAIEIMHRRYYEGRPERIAALEEAVANDEVARKIYELRTKAGLTQRQLAKLVGTTASVICLLEDADYEGHSLSMLR